MKVIVTAGPTRESIDPVRFITNRSSGKMGYALAEAALQRGHEVRLVSGPVILTPPERTHITLVETASEMLDAVQQNIQWCDVLIMAAAVADWRPAKLSVNKLKKAQMQPRLELEPTTDVLESLAKHKGGRIFVGFSADTDNIIIEATRKLKDKGLDLVVANDITVPGAGFGTDTNVATLVSREDPLVELPLMTKEQLASRILEWVESTACVRFS